MDEGYTYQEPVKPVFGPIPAGDYDFAVTSVNPIYRSKPNNNLVLPVVLAVGPDKTPVYDNPSAGVGKNGPYDNIAGFLKAIGKNPKPGERPNLSATNLVGARGAARIKIEIAQEGKLAGQEVNKVHYYLWEDDRKAGDQEPPDVPRSRPGDGKAIIPPPPAAKGEPRDIPFKTNIYGDAKLWRNRARVIL